MKKTRSKWFYAILILFSVFFIASCAVGFAACGGGDGDEDEDDNQGGATVSTVSISQSALTLGLGDEDTKSAQLTASVTMSDGSNYGGSYTWSSSNTSVVSLSSSTTNSVTVTAVADGTANITVTAGGVTSSACAVTVKTTEPDTPYVTAVTLDSESLSLYYQGSSSTLTASATMSDGNVYTGSYSWESSAPGVASVTPGTDTSTATVAPVAVGSATITVTAGGQSATCPVTVSAVASGISLDKTELSLVEDGESGTINATISMNDGKTSTTDTITWSQTSSDGGEVSISGGSSYTAGSALRGTESGYIATISGTSAGTVTVTATVDGTNISASCTVTVTEPYVTGISLSSPELHFVLKTAEQVGDTVVQDSATLTASVDLNNGKSDNTATVTWSVEEKGTDGQTANTGSVITYTDNQDNTMTITPVAIGSATITATYTVTATEGGNTTTATYTDACEVNVYNNTNTYEAEYAALFNSTSVSDFGSSFMASTELLDVEDSTSFEGVTQVKNFNVAGDKIVFQLDASAAISDVTIDAIVSPTNDDFDASEHEGFISVNGQALSATGKVSKSAYGAVTAKASLNAGINYVEITLDVSGSSLLGMNMGYMNVDRIELDWDGNTTVDMIQGQVASVVSVAAAEKVEIGAEGAYILNVKGATTSTDYIAYDTTSSTVDGETVTTVTGIKNISAGDMIVYQINSSVAETVDMNITGNSSSASFTVSVNGKDVAAESDGSFVVTLGKGVNYIQLTAATGVSSASISGIELLCRHELTGTYTVDETTGEGTWTYTCGICGATIDVDTTQNTVADIVLQASDEGSLKAAIELGGTVELTQDITLTKTLEISEEVEVTIDLNGKTITAGAVTTTDANGDDMTVGVNTIEVGSGATLTIVDSVGTGKIENTYKSGEGESSTSVDNAAAIEVNGGTLIIESGTISSSSVGIRAKAGTVEINGGEVWSSGYYALWESEGEVDVTINDGIVGGDWGGILVDGDSNFGYTDGYQYDAVTTLTITGGVVYSGGEGQAAIRTESMTSTDSAIITITGGIIYGAQAAPAIFIGNGTLTISDGYIVGSTALEVQAGKTAISGGTFVATGEEQTVDNTTSNSASFSNGYALTFYPRGYIGRCTDSTFSMALEVSITGGTFVGDIYVAATNVHTGTNVSQWTLNDETDGNYKVAISGGLGLTCSILSDEDGETVAYVYTQGTVSVPFGDVTFNEGTFNGTTATVTETTAQDGTVTVKIDDIVANVMSDEQKAAFDASYASDTTTRYYIAVQIAVQPGESVKVVASGVEDTVSNDTDAVIYTTWVIEIGQSHFSGVTAGEGEEYVTIDLSSFSMSVTVTASDSTETSFTITFGNVLVAATDLPTASGD